MPRSPRQATVYAVGLLLLAGGGVWLAIGSLGKTSELERAELALEQRDFRAARVHLERHLETHPHDADAILLTARTVRREGDPAAASVLLDRYEKTAGQTDAARLEWELLAVQRGNAKLAAGLLAGCRDSPQATSTALALETILETTLNLIRSRYDNHLPLPDQNLKQTPIEHAQEAIALWFARPLTAAERVQGHIWRARLREIAGEHVGAVADLRDAIALDPEHRYANHLLALFLFQENPEESRRIFEKLLAQQPNDLNCLFATVGTLKATGRVDEAGAMLDRLIEREPDLPRALQERAAIALELQKPAEAEPLLRRALDAAPNEPELHAAMSRCMRQLGRTEDAARHLDRFRQLERERQTKK